MRKRRTKRVTVDPRAHTPPGHFLKNAPWRRDFAEEPRGPVFSLRESIVLALLVGFFVVVAAALWVSPPHLLRFQPDPVLAQGKTKMAGNRVPRPYKDGLPYDPAKFEEVKDDDPLLEDDSPAL